MKCLSVKSLTIVSLGLVLAISTGRAQAQQFPYNGIGGSTPENRGPYSPYLNLLRSNSSPTVNYFGIVRPELNFYSSNNLLGQQIDQNSQSINSMQSGGLPITGHPAAFLNLGGYFQSRFGSGNTGMPGQSSAGRSSVQGVGSQGLFGSSNGLFGNSSLFNNNIGRPSSPR